MTASLWQPPKDRPFIKVCGLTRPDNAAACVSAGADIIGLVFFEKSPRNVSMAAAKAVTKALPADVPACGVFVDDGFDRIMERVTACGLSAVQLHGSEPPELVRSLANEGVMVIKALFASKSPGLKMASRYPDARYILLECGKGKLPGGNAKSWDYRLAQKISHETPVILAGGLTPGTVAQAIATAGPAGVDVSSGVESGPGIKDVERVTDFAAQCG